MVSSNKGELHGNGDSKFITCPSYENVSPVTGVMNA